MTPQAERFERPPGLRRRRFTAAHRRRSLLLRLLKPLTVALAVVGAPVGAAGWVLFGPQFRLQELAVEGTERVSREWVLSRIAPLTGHHLVRLSLADLESALGDHPWIDGVSMRKRLPDALVVRVDECRPAALLRRDDGLFYVDASGEIIDRFDAERGPVDLLLLHGAGADRHQIAGALAAAREFGRLAPAWGLELSEIEILNEEDLRFHTAALPFALLLGATGIDAGLRRLRRNLPAIRERFASAATLDVRFSGRIVVVPTTAPQAEER